MKGYFLPGISIQEDHREINGLLTETPRLSPSKLTEIADQLISAQGRLSRKPILNIIDCIDEAARCWLDSNDSIRQEAESLLPVITGASREMVHFALNDLFSNLTRPVLLDLLEEELGDPMVLDDFRPRRKGRGRTRAFGPTLITHILPGNIPGASIISLVLGLLAKSANLAKVGSGEFLLPILFAESLYKIQPDLARNLAVLTWDHAAVEITEAAFQKADLAIIYGNDETIKEVRRHLPQQTRAIFHGHRLSLGVIARESIHLALAQEAASDIVLYDQRGCLSPHLYYVEESGHASPLQFAKWLAQALYFAGNKFPKGATSPAEAARIQQLRRSIPLKGGTVIASPSGTDWTVLYDPDPAFSTSPLARTIWIKPIHDIAALPTLLEPIRSMLQGIGISIPQDRQPEVIPQLAKMGACRICPIGKMQRPPLTWHHDGRFRILNLLRFVDFEN